MDAVATQRPEALRVVLGADWRRFVPTERVDREDVYAFLSAWAKQHKIVSKRR